MTDHINNKPYEAFIAIDIAKDFNAVLCETKEGKRQHFRMANSAKDHERLITYLKSLPAPCVVGFEATGNYHRPIGHRLVAEGFDTFFISSLASARYREVMFNSWDKNDPKDATVLLELLKQGITQRYIDPLIAGHHDLQELSKTYYQITLSRTRLQHSLLTHYLPLYFPEMGKWWHSTRADWWISYLLRCPVPSAITKYTQDEFCQIASPIIGRKVNKAAKLIELYETAQHSIALPIKEESLACKTFQVQLRRYQEINECRTQLELTAQSMLASNPDSAILQSVPGIVEFPGFSGHFFC